MKTKKFLFLGCLLLATVSFAHAEDNPSSALPSVDAEDTEQLPVANEEPGDDLPAPSLGNDGTTGNSKNQAVEESTLPPEGTADEFYTPKNANGTDYTLPVASNQGPTLMSGGNSEELFPRDNDFTRPTFQMYLGGATKAYPTTLVPDNITGIGAGISLRVLRLGETVFLHGIAEISYFSLGTVGNWPGVKDRTYHVGGLLEVALGRRVSLFGALERRWNYVTTDPHTDLPSNQRQLFNVNEEARWHLGAGAQYDFYVIPHGSLGARLYLEQDYGMISLVMALEPKPKKKLSLNYQGI